MSATTQPCDAVATLQIVFHALVAFGTIALAVVAVFQDRIRAWLDRPRLTIEPRPAKECYSCPLRDAKGVMIPAYWFGLRVKNNKPKRPARDCQVLLDDMYRWDSQANRWEANRPPIPYPYVWAPGHMRRPTLNVRNTAVFDFGKIVKKHGSAQVFAPELQYRASSYNPTLQPGETGLYVLRIEADHLPRGPRRVWQYCWDGTWHDDDELSMAQHVTMKEIEMEQFLNMVQESVPPESKA